MRSLKRQLSDIACHQMVLDAGARAAGPGGHLGAATGSSAAGLHPAAGTSEKSLPGPTSDPTPPRPARSSGRSAVPAHAGPQPLSSAPLLGRGAVRAWRDHVGERLVGVSAGLGAPRTLTWNGRAGRHRRSPQGSRGCLDYHEVQTAETFSANGSDTLSDHRLCNSTHRH